MPAPPSNPWENNVRNSFSVLAAAATAALLAGPAWSADAMKGDMKKAGAKSEMKSDMKSGDAKMAGTYTNPSEVKWGDAPPVFPKGAKMAVLEGDPFKAGPYVARLKMPGNYKIAAHWHTNDEDLTIVSGEFFLGEGDKLDMKGHGLKAGGFHHLPGKTHHYAYTKGDTVVQINAMGPFDITYVDAKEDPSKMAAPMKKDEMKKKM